MKAYLSHFSAAAFWNIPYIEAVLGSKIDGTGLVYFTVSERCARSFRKGQIAHLCKHVLPAGAVVSKNGTMVASPELVFLQLVCKLNIHQCILLALQLCSYPPGKPSEALTTKQKLKVFLEKTPGYPGHRKALRAIKYIEDGSASVMESMTYMILTLPHALGGYRLRGAVFNHEIKLKDETGKRLGQKRCFADLYYKPSKLAVEYESFAFHNSPFKQGKDMVRSSALERQGVDVMHLSTIQLYDKEACMEFAFNLACRLGKRIQIRTKEFDRMHGLLRTLLPAARPATNSDGGGL